MKTKDRAQKSLASNPRWQALLILHQVEYEGGYSNDLINQTLSQAQLSDLDQNLMVQLVYGVIQRRYSLDYYLAPFIQGKKIDTWVESLLRMTIYQLVYLDRIPDHAAINEAVEIAKLNGHKGLGSFVNAVLRNFQRQPLQDPAEIRDDSQRLAVTYSIQPWIVDLLKQELADQELEVLLASLLEDPVVATRVQAGPDQRAQLMDQLQEEGFQVEASPMSPWGIRVLEGNPIHSPLYEAGALTIQDESSMLVAPLGKLEADHYVLDACAAPGGKATHIAQYLAQGRLDALDISVAKLGRVKDHAQRLGLADRIEYFHGDASNFEPKNGQLYDRIYLDAPCSGLGLMRRKPEIKYNKQVADLANLQTIQLAILNNVCQYLKVGGYLIYSTCTLTSQENEAVIDHFLAQHQDYRLDPILPEELLLTDLINDQGQVRVWPHHYHTDGFFICRLVKIQ